MKKIFPFFLAVFLLTGCKNNDPDVKFEMVYERDFNILAGLNTFDTHYFYLRDIPIGSYLTANNVTAEELTSINPKSARMSAILSGGGDYDFIREVSVQIFTDNEDNAREVFWRNQIPFNQGEDLDLLGSLIDAKEFLGNTKFNLFVKLDLRGVPPQTIETKLRFSFQAK